jgi:hypothetical protein
MRSATCLGVVVLVLACRAAGADEPAVVRSARSGPWSAAETWASGRVPPAGARVLVAAGHRVVYDVDSDQPIRSVHVAGVLTFARDRDTRLDVGLVVVQRGEDTTESGFDCAGGDHPPGGDRPAGRPAAAADGGAATRPAGADDAAPQAVAVVSSAAALEVGTAADPIPAGRTARLRLTYFPGTDKDSLPALVCCGGRMDFHGAALPHPWTRLAAPAAAGDATVALADPADGWRPGDRVIVTATVRQNKQAKTFRPSTRDQTQTEERTVAAVRDGGRTLALDRPLTFAHAADGDYRADVADLSRNVVVESADPAAARGHTMYHRSSAGSIAYAEFRHLGKPGVLGRYSLHFHLAGDSMRGSSVVGASVWDSGNRWLTIHGTNYLVVRDCVGYQSAGHGFFLENGTEQYNVLDHNLAVQAYGAKPLAGQALPFDPNDGAGFWWANSLNAFTRNVAAECDEYGYFFQAVDAPDFHVRFDVRQPDGTRKPTDVRTIPFLRFDDNEANCQRRHGFNLGGGVPFGPPGVAGVARVGPDARHPFVIRDFRAWNVHWAIHPFAPSVLIDGLDCHACEYGIWRPDYQGHAYRRVRLDQIKVSPEFMPTGGKRPPESDYPKPADPVDDLPPVTVVTGAAARGDGRLVVRGTTSDNGRVAAVVVNGLPATATRENFAEWEAVLDAPAGRGPTRLTAGAVDAAGNAERTPHVLTVDPPP